MLRITVFLLAIPLFAGGFWLEIGTADASPEAKANQAVMIVRATGCHDPATAEVSGFVLQTIDGKRHSSPLKLIRMKAPGTYAVVRDWPADAGVTLKFVGHEGSASTSMLVQARGDKVEKASAKFYPHEPTVEEEAASLVR